MIMLLSQRRVAQLSLCGVLLFAVNFLFFAELTANNVDQADLNLLAGHIFVLDPGHGGVDSGATANGVVEKTVNLAIAKILEQILTNHGATVIMTREQDIDYYTKGTGGKRRDLNKRIEIINQANAELFVSIHLNAINNADMKGAQVFFGGKSEESAALAVIMQQAVKSFPPGNHRQPLQDLAILVLNETDIPGVLVECGYVTNKSEAEKLLTIEYQQKIAWQIAKGLAYHSSEKVSR